MHCTALAGRRRGAEWGGGPGAGTDLRSLHRAPLSPHLRAARSNCKEHTALALPRPSNPDTAQDWEGVGRMKQDPDGIHLAASLLLAMGAALACSAQEADAPQDRAVRNHLTCSGLDLDGHAGLASQAFFSTQGSIDAFVGDTTTTTQTASGLSLALDDPSPAGTPYYFTIHSDVFGEFAGYGGVNEQVSSPWAAPVAEQYPRRLVLVAQPEYRRWSHVRPPGPGRVHLRLHHS